METTGEEKSNAPHQDTVHTVATTLSISALPLLFELSFCYPFGVGVHSSNYINHFSPSFFLFGRVQNAMVSDCGSVCRSMAGTDCSLLSSLYRKDQHCRALAATVTLETVARKESKVEGLRETLFGLKGSVSAGPAVGSVGQYDYGTVQRFRGTKRLVPTSGDAKLDPLRGQCLLELTSRGIFGGWRHGTARSLVGRFLWVTVTRKAVFACRGKVEELRCEEASVWGGGLESKIGARQLVLDGLRGGERGGMDLLAFDGFNGTGPIELMYHLADKVLTATERQISSPATQFSDFIEAVTWSEPFIRSVIVAQTLLLVLVLLTRRKLVVHLVLFTAICKLLQPHCHSRGKKKKKDHPPSHTHQRPLSIQRFLSQGLSNARGPPKS